MRLISEIELLWLDLSYNPIQTRSTTQHGKLIRRDRALQQGRKGGMLHYNLPCLY